MKAAVMHRAGDPSVLQIEDVAVPGCGPEDVLIRVQACGVSSRDVVERNGTYQRDVVFPLIIGLEMSGVVVETGADVRTVSVGDHVCTKAFSSCGHCRLCRQGRESTCFARKPVRGGYGQFARVSADAVVRVPATIPFDQSCTLGPAAGVALNAVRDSAEVRLGETVLVSGASGGVGSASVQLCHHSGARIIALTRDPRKEAALREDGADHVVVMGDGSTHRELVARIKDLTDGLGVDVVIDTVGSRAFDVCFDSLAVHGRYAFVGELTGEQISINPARIFFKRAHLIGVGSVSRSQVEDVCGMVVDGLLNVRVARTLPLSEVVRAHQLVEAAANVGRIVLKPWEQPEG